MQRSNFITLVGGVAAAHVLPAALRAQVSKKSPRIAVLSGVTLEDNQPLRGFMGGLRELGYVEGQNIDVVYRFAEGRLDRFATLADELIQLKPDVIVAFVTPAAVAARNLTQTIPIVCPLLATPIEFGLIASMSRPGGNVTGLMFRIDDLAGKQLELAVQLVPGLVRVGLIVNVAAKNVIIDRQEAESAASRLGIKLIAAEVRAPNELDRAFQALSSEDVQAVVVLVDALFFQERKRIAALAATARLPAVYGFRDHVDAGGLISYGVNLPENFRRMAIYVVKILNGARPGELPVEFPNKLELIINLNTAKALGLDIPASLLARADEVIE
jgi:putative ABC transport system substrate-binding protein